MGSSTADTLVDGVSCGNNPMITGGERGRPPHRRAGGATIAR
jgi:hypothetical protein